jgi:hypothetical protein
LRRKNEGWGVGMGVGGEVRKGIYRAEKYSVRGSGIVDEGVRRFVWGGVGRSGEEDRWL